MSETTESRLAAAVGQHKAGNVPAAVQVYQSILAAEPDHAGALHYMGLAYLGAGKPVEAEKFMRRSTAADPSQAKVWSNLALACQQQNRLDAAEDALRRAIDADPGFADAPFNLGVILSQRSARDHDAAISLFRDALAIDPSHGGALMNLSSLLQSLDRFEEAREISEQLLAAMPEEARAFSNHGHICTRLDDIPAARTALEKALVLNPQLAEAHNNLGNALQAAGELDAATEAFRQAIRLRPDYAEAWRHLSMVYRFTPDDDPEYDALARLSAGKLSDEQKMHMEFAMAKADRDRGAYHTAFTHLLEANRLKRQRVKYDLTDEARYFERLKKCFHADLLKVSASAPAGGPVPVFILGMPRSGTTLVEQILGCHQDIHGAGELGLVGQIFREIFPDRETLDPDRLTGPAMAEAGGAYIRQIQRIAPDARYICDKLPDNYRHIGLIALALPQAKIIHCTRTAEDTCLSIFENYFTGDIPYAYDLTELGGQYRLYQSLMAHWHACVPGRILDVAYEDILDDLEGQARRMLDHCDLGWDPACLSFHESGRIVHTASASQVRQKLYRHASQKWRHYESWLQPLQTALAGTGEAG